MCMCAPTNAPPHTHIYIHTHSPNDQLSFFSEQWPAAQRPTDRKYPSWSLSFWLNDDLTRGFITLTLIPADLSRIIMLHYNRSAILGKECIIWTQKDSKCKGVPDKEHVFIRLKWAISSRVNVKEGFGECAPFTSFSVLWGLRLFKTAKTSMQVYLKDEGIFWMVFWGCIIWSWVRISAVRHFELCFLSW